MVEKNLRQRFITIGIVVVIALLVLFRWDSGSGLTHNLRPGQDIAGGFSMIFEIDDTGVEDWQRATLAEDMKALLQKRVDPTGVSDIQWSVLGQNRIEVRMPLPPPEAKDLQDEYLAALDKLIENNTLTRSAIFSAMEAQGDARQAAIEGLVGANPARKPLLEQAATAFDAWQAAKAAVAAGPQPASEPAEGETAEAPKTADDLKIEERDAEEEYRDIIDELLEENFPAKSFSEALSLDQNSAIRANIFENLKQKYPSLTKEIDDVIAKNAAWKEKRGFLDGPADLRRMLSGAGVLEFRILADPPGANTTRYDTLRRKLDEEGLANARDDRFAWFRVDNPPAFFNVKSIDQWPREQLEAKLGAVIAKKSNDEFYVLSRIDSDGGLLHEAGKTKWRLERASVTRDQSGRRAVAFQLDAVGGDLFRKLTRANVNKQLCILVDDVAYSTANINEEIGASGQISGDFSTEKLNYLVQTMQAGALPARLKDTPLSERAVGSSLGQSNLKQAFTAGMIGLVVVIIIMLGYYTIAGAVANVALLLNVLFVLAAMAMLGARFTLAGIAGVILTIGMAVDANVLIFERMREERERGASLRVMIKNGYEKAFSTIIDANITTLLTSLILFYVGSEEIKGFGLTLGWGIVISLFTALFVTRTLFSWMAKAGMIKDLKMAKLIGVPNINWYGMRGGFAVLSAIIIIPGVFLLWTRGADSLDVEFRGGVNAEIELRREANLDDPAIQKLLSDTGDRIAKQGENVGQATVEPVANAAQVFRVSAPNVSAEWLAAIIAEPLEEIEPSLVERGGVEVSPEGDAVIVQATAGATANSLQAAIRGLGAGARQSGANIAASRVGAVLGGGPEDKGRFWDITTTETNKRLVQVSLVSALGDKLVIQPRIAHRFVGQSNAEQLPYPITNRRLSAVVPSLPDRLNQDLTDFLGGAAIVLDKLEPAISVEDFEDRLRAMRLQPDYANVPWRRFEVIGVDPAGKDADGHETYTRAVVLVTDPDPDFAYTTDPDRWAAGFATQEVALVTATLDREQTLRKVTQFKPQIAAQAQGRATMALLLSWAMIIGYLWIRFGRPAYGVAGVVALIHDVFVALAFLGYAGFIGGSSGLGGILLIDKFKIDMTVIAAFLTIVGYSINDTIVVFDRIREARGRLGRVTADVVNRAINECLSRTIMTSLTTLVVLIIMFAFGGSSIRAFSYCMIIGVLTGTYSSIAVAAPLLLIGSRVEDKRTAAAEPVTV